MSDEKLTFEQAFEQLEQVVQQLEAGDLSLDRSLELYRKGMALARLCQETLDQAEQQVQRIAGIGDDGLELVPFARS